MSSMSEPIRLTEKQAGQAIPIDSASELMTAIVARCKACTERAAQRHGTGSGFRQVHGFALERRFEAVAPRHVAQQTQKTKKSPRKAGSTTWSFAIQSLDGSRTVYVKALRKC
jgi:hypothetical protein